MDKWKVIGILELIALIFVIGWLIMATYQNGKEIRQCNSKLEETNSLKSQLETCKDDFLQDELLIENLQETIDECKDGWGEAIDGWDRCLGMLR